MISKCYRVLDPLDIEVLERAFDEALTACKEGETAIEADCDQALETALRRDLIEIARLYGIAEPDTLRALLAGSACVRDAFPSMCASDQS